MIESHTCHDGLPVVRAMASPASAAIGISWTRPGHSAMSIVSPTDSGAVLDLLAEGAGLLHEPLDQVPHETVDPRRPVECFGKEASARAHELLDGEHVYLEYDPTQGKTDRYGRVLAYVWLPDGTLVNEAMIADGYAYEYTYDVPYRYRDRFDTAEAEARDDERGLWAAGVC